MLARVVTRARAARACKHVYEAARRVGAGLLEHNALEAASSIAFWFFLSFIPALVFAGFVLGQLARSRGVHALLDALFDVAPSGATAIIASELERMAGASGTALGPIGVVGFLWTSSSGIHNLMDVFEIAVRVKRRPWWKQRVMALGSVLAMLAVAVFASWLVIEIEGHHVRHHRNAAELAQAPRWHFPTLPPVRAPVRAWFRHLLDTTPEHVAAGVLLLALSTALLAGFYRFAVEHPIGVQRRAWPGAFAAVGCWLVASWGFGRFVATLADYTVYYGSLAAVAVLMIWLYLTSLALLIGAEVNAQLEGVRDISA
jgi:membrane protein